MLSYVVQISLKKFELFHLSSIRVFIRGHVRSIVTTPTWTNVLPDSRNWIIKLPKNIKTELVHCLFSPLGTGTQLGCSRFLYMDKALRFRKA